MLNEIYASDFQKLNYTPTPVTCSFDWQRPFSHHSQSCVSGRRRRISRRRTVGGRRRRRRRRGHSIKWAKRWTKTQKGKREATQKWGKSASRKSVKNSKSGKARVSHSIKTSK